jgi:hypothetical protein
MTNITRILGRIEQGDPRAAAYRHWAYARAWLLAEGQS